MTSDRNTIVLVDDQTVNLTASSNMLKTFYRVIPVPSASEMFAVLENVIPDIILLDIAMPDMDGYEAIKILKADERFANIPVIFLTAKDDAKSEVEGLALGASDYITKPLFAPLLLKRISKELHHAKKHKELVETQTALEEHSENLEALIQEKALEIARIQNGVLETVVDLVEFRDKYTGGHVQRTQRYLKILIDAMIQKGVYMDEISKWDIEAVLSSSKLHDVGKIAVPDIVLIKPGKLDPEESIKMKAHVLAGVDIIERMMENTEKFAFLRYALNIAGTHHERWDGSGYPTGLSGKDIPLEGRLMAIGDVYDALVSTRPYKEPLSHEEACRIIESGKGTQFDPELVDVFLNTKDEFEKIAFDCSNERETVFPAIR